MNLNDVQIIFYDPRFKMGAFGRLTVRVVSAVFYGLLVAAVPVAFLSDILWLRWLGLFLGLFVLDRILHAKEADIPLAEVPEKGNINLAYFMVPVLLRALERASDRSAIKDTDVHLEITSELLRRKEIREALARLDISPDNFEDKLDELLKRSTDNSGVKVSEEIEKLASMALREALARNAKFIKPSDIIAATARLEGSQAGKLFRIFDINPSDLENALIFSMARKRFSLLSRLPGSMGGFMFEKDRRTVRHRVMNRAWTARPTPVLDQFGADYTDLARDEKVGFLIGHKAEYARMTDALARSVNPNVILIGDPGIGKETLIGHLAFNLTKDKVPKSLFDKRLVGLDIARMAAGATPEEVQARMQKISDEIIKAGNIILYIPDIHNLTKTSGEAYISAADALLPIIGNNAFPVVGSTYPRDFKAHIEPRSDFTEVFEMVRVEEISEEEARTLLVYGSIILEEQSGRMITFGAVKMAVKLAHRYFREKFLPGSAEELLKTAIQMAERKEEETVNSRLVIAAAEERTNVPIREASREEAERLLNLEEEIHQRIVGQEEAVTAVSNALREYRSGLSRKGSPIASFLFVGPTGVGKTELAKTLAELEFGSEDIIVRLDMTEYQDKQSFFRLIGSPDGSVSGALTDAVLKRPYSLVLLDEFEKAYPDILDLFLQVLDDGRLTDNLGRTVSFENTIIIATSNAHSDIINNALSEGQSMVQIAEYLKRKLTDVFKPELINRFSRIVVFRDLKFDDVKKIALIQLEGVARTAEEQGIMLSFSPEAVTAIAKKGYDPAFGARPLRRVIDEHIRSGLAKFILKAGEARGRQVRVALDEQGSFIFKEEGDK